MHQVTRTRRLMSLFWESRIVSCSISSYPIPVLAINNLRSKWNWLRINSFEQRSQIHIVAPGCVDGRLSCIEILRSYSNNCWKYCVCIRIKMLCNQCHGCWSFQTILTPFKLFYAKHITPFRYPHTQRQPHKILCTLVRTQSRGTTESDCDDQ